MPDTLTPGDVVTCAGACAVVVATTPREVVLVSVVSRMGRHRADVPLPKGTAPVANAVARCSRLLPVALQAATPLGLSVAGLLPAIMAAIRRERENQQFEDAMGGLGRWHRDANAERSVFA